MNITITNFGQVDDHIWRGAQPATEQFAELKALGITLDIDLREPVGREAEAAACAANGITHINLPMGDQNIPLVDQIGILPPTHEQVEAIMRLMGDRDEKVFIHCEHGQDRTGAAVACYRMVIDGWDNARAFAEAEAFHISPLQLAIRWFIRDFKASDYQK
jgi:protein tyrosine/serine phosphatase